MKIDWSLIWQRTCRGCGYLEGYGHHPGIGSLVFLIFVGILAGSHRGWAGSAISALAMGTFFGSVFLIGAYERAKSHSKEES